MGTEYQEKVNKTKQLLFRQDYPSAGKTGLKNYFLKLNNRKLPSIKFRVAGGEPSPYCPTLAAWYDKIYLYYDDQSTLEPYYKFGRTGLGILTRVVNDLHLILPVEHCDRLDIAILSPETSKSLYAKIESRLCWA
jgi:hypothetical protein